MSSVRKLIEFGSDADVGSVSGYVEHRGEIWERTASKRRFSHEPQCAKVGFSSDGSDRFGEGESDTGFAAANSVDFDRFASPARAVSRHSCLSRLRRSHN